MNVKKQIISAIVTATMLTSISTMAFATDEKLELVVESTPIEIYCPIGENMFLDYDVTKLGYISEDDIGSFAETGKLSYSMVTDLYDFFDCGDTEKINSYFGLEFVNGYYTIGKYDNETEEIISKYHLYFDGSELTVLENTDSVNTGMSRNGYIAYLEDDSKNDPTVLIKAPDGTVSTLDFDGKAIVFAPFDYMGGYTFMFNRTSSTKIDDDNKKYEITLCVINENAEVKEIQLETYGKNNGLSNVCVADNFVLFGMTTELNSDPVMYVYLTDIDELIALPYFPGDATKDVYIDLYGETKLHNGIMPVYFTPEGSDEEICTLIDINQGGKQISDEYLSISSECDNGETYLAQSLDGKWGFLNNKGEELAFFDDASSFDGNHALILIDGMAYLIDHDMNIVSNGVKAEHTEVLCENLFAITIGDKKYAVTFNVSERTNESVDDEIIVDNTDSTIIDTDAVVDTSKGIPDTGADDIVTVTAIYVGLAGLAICVVTVGVSVFSKKRR